ncbi:conserved hypothetical protein [Parafrankia sp. EUN1f]|nr:conserved hypothetical protein [Parafrankia sp. EUN1f]
MGAGRSWDAGSRSPPVPGRRATTTKTGYVVTYRGGMCRNITELRGLAPPATDDEIEAAALQFVRKVSGLRQPPAAAAEAFEVAVAEVAASVHRLLGELPARRTPPATVPPLRRPEVQARLTATAATATTATATATQAQAGHAPAVPGS